MLKKGIVFDRKAFLLSYRMNTITHSLLPVIGTGIDKKRHRKIAEYWNLPRVLAVAAFGAMPDLLNPHISLESRYSSWSHGLPLLFSDHTFGFCAGWIEDF